MAHEISPAVERAGDAAAESARARGGRSGSPTGCSA